MPLERPPLILIPDSPRGTLPLSAFRIRPSSLKRGRKVEDFYSDKSRIVFCSSFRRLMQKAQVFSLESNTSVRNRLTHSIEVADIGRTIAREVGERLHEAGLATLEEVECIQTIVESACLLHDIGNPPFGHFGEDAIKTWFTRNGSSLLHDGEDELNLGLIQDPRLGDLYQFDGNPQGFRIATRLHCDIDEFGLNLTSATLMSAVKYPNCGTIARDALFPKKLGVFFSEKEIYENVAAAARVQPGRRYFLSYLMELADDICYCLSDIADGFEKGLITSREFKHEFARIAKDQDAEPILRFIPKRDDPITNFGYQVSIPVARQLVREAAQVFVTGFDAYLDGYAKELTEDLPSGAILSCLKTYCRRFIYTDREVQRLEIAGSKVVEGLLEHFGRLLRISRSDFRYFIDEKQVPKARGLDTEWRIFNQLSSRMLKAYEYQSRGCGESDERIVRARLIVDFIAGMTDNSALATYQNFMGILL